MFTLLSFSQSSLRVAEFVGLHINVRNALSKYDGEELGLPEGMTDKYSEAVELIVDQNRGDVSSEFTAKMKEADAVRDNLFRRMRHKLSLVEFAGSDSALVACRDQAMVLLRTYPAKIISEAYQEQTSHIEGFLKDVRTKLSTDNLTALDLTDDAAALEDANAVFISAYADRATQRAEGDTGLTEKLRAQVTELYNQIMLCVQFHANDTSNAACAKSNQTLLALVNQFVKESKHRLNQRLGGGGVESPEDGDNSGETTDDGNKPSGDNKPADDKPSSGSDSKPSDDSNATPPEHSDDNVVEY